MLINIFKKSKKEKNLLIQNVSWLVMKLEASLMLLVVQLKGEIQYEYNLDNEN